MRIVAVDYRIARWPIAPRGAARGRWTERASVILAVRDDAGATGLGEAAPLPGMSIDELDDALRACEALAAQVPFILDGPAQAIDLAAAVTAAPAAPAAHSAPAARFAIETALLTLLAQRTRTSVAGLLAGAAHLDEPSLAPLRNAVVVDDEDEARASVARGATCLKIKAPSPTDLDPLSGIVHRIARAVPGTMLRIDANRGWPREVVEHLLASIADLPIEYVEEPCIGAHELLSTERLGGELLRGEPRRGERIGGERLGGERLGGERLGGERLGGERLGGERLGNERLGDERLGRDRLVRIALDESLIELGRHDLERALSSPRLAALVLKPTLLGGFARCLELAALARAHGVAPVVSHTLEGAVGTAACRELARAIGADVAVGLAPHVAEHGSHLAWPASHGAEPAKNIGAIEHEQERDIPRMSGEPPRHADDLPRRTAADDLPRRTAADSRGPRPLVLVATHTDATVATIRAAFAEREPIALLHAKATIDEQARQRALLDATTFEPDDAVVLFTSGSTGPSRGVVLSRQALVANAEASAAHLGWRADDRWLACLPLAHAGGLSIVIRCLLADKPLVLGEVTELARPGADRDAPITIASLVPAQLAQLLDDPSWRPSPQLRAVLLGGAAAPPALVEAALARGVPVLQTYGLTETFGQVATARVAGGRPVPLVGTEIRAGTAEAPAPIRIRGPMLATRYLDGTPIAPELATADLGFLACGELHVLGRADEVIISGGENVHPTQVEAVLAATPGVRAAAAFGVSDARWGQVVAVVIAVAPGFDRVQALAQWHAQLPPHARPRHLAIIAELPRLPSGKVDRRALGSVATAIIEYAPVPAAPGTPGGPDDLARRSRVL